MTDPHSSPLPIESLLDRMSLPEKVGQLFMMAFEGAETSESVRELIQDCHVGGIILYSITGNLQTPEQILRLTQGIQAFAQIPVLIGIDEEGGGVRRLPPPATAFPSAMTLGATRSPELARRMGRGIATELGALGINVNFAPVVDVNSNPRNPIIGTRACGSDPELVVCLGQSLLEGQREAGVIPTLKHFPGHGDTEIDSHLGLPRVDHGLDHLQRIEMRPFQRLIQQGAELVMTAHVVVPALGSGERPATLAPEVLEDWLRGRLGFKGVIITDSLTMGALDRIWGGPEAAELALQAGADLLLFGADRGHDVAEGKIAYQQVLARVQAGVISEERINTSVRRILQLKAQYGILNEQKEKMDLTVIGCSTHHRLAEQITAAGITIVRQDEDRIPLSRERSVLVIWPQPRGDLAAQLGLYHPRIHSHPIPLDPQAEEIYQVQILAAEFEQILVASYNAWVYPGQIQLIRSFPQDKVIVAAMGSPYDLMAFPEISNYVASYGDLPVSLSALAQVLMSVIPAQGKLPIQLELRTQAC